VHPKINNFLLSMTKDELEHPFIKLKAQVEQQKTEISKLKSKSSRQASHLQKSIEGNMQILKRMREELQNLKDTVKLETEKILSWTKNQLQEMSTNGILVDPTELKLRNHPDLLRWIELREAQQELGTTIKAIKSRFSFPSLNQVNAGS